MSDVLEFLERVGKHARFSATSRSEFELALAASNFDAELKQALLKGDTHTLEVLLGITPMCAMLIPGEEQEDEQESPDREDDEKEPDTGEGAQRSMLRTPESRH